MGNKQRTAKTGKKLGRYRIERELGRGGMGVVYLATDENLGRRIALKTTSMAQMGSSEQARNQRQARFVREVKALGQVNHENVVHVFDAGESDDPELGWLLYYSMQFVDGITLAQMVHKLGALEPGAAAAVCMQVAAGLGAAHQNGIVHRDVKPANIFIDKAGRVLIGDFGICKLEGSTQITRRDQLVGTPNYLAPEQILGEDIVPATDVFALGALFYVIATNSPLRTRVDPASLLKEAQTDDPRNKVLAQQRIQPEALRKIVARAVTRDPKKRFKDCTEFAEALSDHATRVPSFAELTDDNMSLPKQPAVGVDSNTSPFAPMPGGDEDTPLGDVFPEEQVAPEPFDFAGSGAAGVEEAALALLKDAGIEVKRKKKKKKASAVPAPEPAPPKGSELPVARTESTVMFNLRKLEDEERDRDEVEEEEEALEPELTPIGAGAGGELPVARAESTVMFNLRQLEDEEKGKPKPGPALAPPPVTLPEAQEALDDDTADPLPVDDETSSPGTPAPARQAAPPVAPQPALKTVDAKTVNRKLRGPASVPPAALYVAAAVGGGFAAACVLLMVGWLMGGEDQVAPVDDSVAADRPMEAPALVVDEPPAACAGKARNKKARARAATKLKVANTLLGENQRKDAIRTVDDALKQDPRLIAAHVLRARLAAEDGDIARALDGYRCVLYIAPDSDEGLKARQALERFAEQRRAPENNAK